MTYRASLGSATIAATAFVIALTTVSFGIGWFVPDSYGEHRTGALITGTVLTAIVLGCYLRRTVAYNLSAHAIIIKRVTKDITIPISEVQDAFSVKKETMSGTLRIWGNGGIFGFTGYWSGVFGNMTWYATRLDHYILIQTRDDKFVITPDDIGMVTEIRRLIGK